MRTNQPPTPISPLRDEIWTPEISQLMADYIDRAEALTVHAELLRSAVESGKDWTEAWHRAEEALNNVHLVRFALARHMIDPARPETPRAGKVLTFRVVEGQSPVAC